jgi:hypothetical protein
MKVNNTTVDLKRPLCAGQPLLLPLRKVRGESFWGDRRKAKSLAAAEDPFDREATLGEAMLEMNLTELAVTLSRRVTLLLKIARECGEKLRCDKLFIGPSYGRRFTHFLGCVQKIFLDLA